MESKKGMIKNFSFRRWMILSGFLFLFTFVVKIIWNYFDKKSSIEDVLTWNELIKRFVISIVMGLVIVLFQKQEKEVTPADMED